MFEEQEDRIAGSTRTVRHGLDDQGLFVMGPSLRLMQQRTVSLQPELTISAQLMFGVLAGTMGLLFATPLTGRSHGPSAKILPRRCARRALRTRIETLKTRSDL